MEQSSDDIWAACCSATRQALKLAGIEGDAVAGIGFDATCSLVALDSEDRPVSVSPTGNAAQNVIVWMDHRAIPQAERINQTRHPVLRYVGGVILPISFGLRRIFRQPGKRQRLIFSPAAPPGMTPGRVIDRVRGKIARYHERKYRIFHRLHAGFLASRLIKAGN